MLEDLLTLEDEFDGSKKGKMEQIKELLSEFCSEFLS
jgi:hypothetical protein